MVLRIPVAVLNPKAKPLRLPPDEWAGRESLRPPNGYDLAIRHERERERAALQQIQRRARDGGRATGKQTSQKASAFRKRIQKVIAEWKASDDRVTVRKLAMRLEVTAKTIERHLKAMDISISRF